MLALIRSLESSDENFEEGPPDDWALAGAVEVVAAIAAPVADHHGVLAKARPTVRSAVASSSVIPPPPAPRRRWPSSSPY